MRFGITILFLICLFANCGNAQQKPTKIAKPHQQKRTEPSQKDSSTITETSNQIDEPINDYLVERLKPIRENFKRINSIPRHDWSAVIPQNMEGTTEGGEVTYYRWNSDLEKIITREYGVAFQKLTEYYLLSNDISFVFEKTLKYNRPIYYDSAAMLEMNDHQLFDISKSEMEEDKSYFENGKLIHLISNQDCGSPFAEEYLMLEQERITYNFKALIKLENKN